MSDERREISNENEIGMFFHCGKCISEMKSGWAQRVMGQPVSMRDYGDYEVGFTKLGVQVWCKRHECNVIHIDFERQKHPANTSAKLSETEIQVRDVLKADPALHSRLLAGDEGAASELYGILPHGEDDQISVETANAVFYLLSTLEPPDEENADD